MTKLISYAQNFEDIMLWRALSHVSSGCYIDVGAQSPDTDSVSRIFYEHGWRGVHVEPTSQYAELLRKRRPDEVVVQAAVSDRAGILQFFGIADTGLSTVDPAVAEMHRAAGYQIVETQVPAVTLDAVLAEVPGDEVHWLKIDVEGAEQKVIDGWTAARPQPWLLVIESTQPLSAAPSHEWESDIIARGYEFVYFDGLNRFYVSEQHPELKAAFGAGPNVFDDFSLSSGSQFCSLVNLSYRDLEAQINERQRMHEAVLHDLEAQLEALNEEVARRRAETVELTAQVDAGKLEANQWWSAHEELRGQMQASTTENEVQRAEIAALAAQVDAGKQEAHRWWSAHESLRAQFDAALQEFRQQRDAVAAENERLRTDAAAMAGQLDASKQEAERWWIAHEALRAELDAALQELRQQRDSVAEENDRLRTETAAMAGQLDASKQEMQHWWIAHGALRTQFDVAREDFEQQRDAAATENERQRAEIAALAAEVERGRQEASRWRKSHEDLCQQLEARDSEIERQKAEYTSVIDGMAQARRRIISEHEAALARTREWAHQEVADLAAQIDVGKREAHRWWLAHEELRSRLGAIERSRSWRWTQPLRAARLRLVARPALRLKQMLRPLVVRSIKGVFAAPWLHRSLKPVVAKAPFVYSRLHVLAAHERLHAGDGTVPEAELQVPVLLDSNERDHAMIYLDKRAARALADLKRSRREKAA